MGCAPSIHVSQSRIVYCREEIRESSSVARASSLSEVVSHIHSSEPGTVTSTVRITTGRFFSSDKRRSVETDSQTHDPHRMDETLQEGRKEITFGPMKLFQNTISILLVFPHEDPQSSAFLLAAHRRSYNTKVCTTLDTAMEYFMQNNPELVIIDSRCPQSIDGENLCRKIRETCPGDNTVIVGVTKASVGTEDVPAVLPLIKIGFNRIFVESDNVGHCYNELVMLEHGEIRSLAKIRAAACLFSATEHCHDSIEIASLDTERGECLLQYANPAFEKLTGHSRRDLTGKTTRFGPYPSNCKDSGSGLDEQIYSQLKKGKTQKWDEYTSQKKNGETFKQNLQIIPVIGRGGKIAHLVAVKQEAKSTTQGGVTRNKPNRPSIGVRDCIASDASRRTSITSAKIEPYITKVINMINSAKEGSSSLIATKLNKVIEILQTKELYSIGNETEEEDEVPPNELFDGLIGKTRRPSGGNILTPSHRQQDTSIFPGRITPLHVTEAHPDILEALEGDALWDYDIVSLEKVTHNKPLYYLGMVIFNRFRACQFLNISEDCLRQWLRLIEANYHEKNTYHNSTHAADVLHSTAYFLMKERVKNTLEPMDEVAALIAAIVHDVDHPGFTNSFLCNASDPLAVLYNDIAVLESHHAALSFKKTAENSSSDIFKGLRADDYRAIRQSIIDMVMATEMTRHFEHLSKFVNSINKRRTSSIGEVTPVGGRGTPDSTASTSVLSTPENRTLIKRMLIKCADISNPARPRFLCQTWANRIAEEYFTQTDEEKRRGLPVVMPVFDRATCNVPRSQVWFIDYFVSDLYDAWDAFAHVPETIRHLTNNYEYWKKEAEDKDELLRKSTLGPSAALTAAPSPIKPTDNLATTASLSSV